MNLIMLEARKYQKTVMIFPVNACCLNFFGGDSSFSSKALMSVLFPWFTNLPNFRRRALFENRFHPYSNQLIISKQHPFGFVCGPTQRWFSRMRTHQCFHQR